MKAPSKTLIIILIVVIALFVAIQIILPDREPDKIKANLVVVSETDIPIGSVGVNYARWDGTSVTEGGLNADNSAIRRGEEFGFEIAGWPVIVEVYSDLDASELLACCVVEEAPPEGCIWEVKISEDAEGVVLVPNSVPGDAP